MPQFLVGSTTGLRVEVIIHEYRGILFTMLLWGLSTRFDPEGFNFIYNSDNNFNLYEGTR